MKFIKAQWEQSVNVIFYHTLWYWIAMFALHGPVWPRMVFLLLFTAINMFGLVWPCLVLYGLFMALYVLSWQKIVFSRGHRSEFIWSCLFFSMLSIDSVYTLGTIKSTQTVLVTLHLEQLKWAFHGLWKMIGWPHNNNRFTRYCARNLYTVGR